MDAVLDWVKNIVMYLIFVSAMMQILPEGHYRKYMQLFIGLVLILLVLQPLTSLKRDLNPAELIYKQYEVWQEKEERSRVLKQLEEREQQSMLRSYEYQLQETIEEQLKNEGYSQAGVSASLSVDGVEQIIIVIASDGQLNRDARKQEQRRLQEQLMELYELPAAAVRIQIK